MTDIQVCVDCTNQLGEGPVWDVAEQRLYWIDSMKNQIWRCSADGSDVRTWELPAAIGSLALRENGGALLALETGLHFFDFDSEKLELVAHPEEGQENVRLNDGKVDSLGRFIVGSLDMETVFDPPARPDRRGALYRLDTDLSLHRLESGMSVSNGPCWSPDQSTFYFTESTDDTIFAYDWDAKSGVASNKREFARLAANCIPDGATVDEEGYLWSAANGAYSGKGELRRYAPDGSLDRIVTMPTPKPTSLMFGGPDLDILFVTGMNIPSEVPETPFDGKLFAVHGLGVRGLPERRFGG
ncbi:calcium-binding protein [Croceicoccus estronivorus]|uniref:SMP-30/gluconolactonase/LRE family protein n=1 Tax=Croceicoccus estronivorus TaxID=1172626 RepID=UPI00082C4A06|nr:SMP-30/gluconolactonase/LRE family protein [Croceicoccus estronivorus]OCC24712.1 calcium-binding protein [Croceicoccus estronivorus]